jgi:putative ATPase
MNAPHRRMRSHGIGVGYRNPHDYDGADVEQQGLPDELVGRRYYEPSDQGWELRIRERMDALLEQRRRGSRRRG